MVAALRAGEVSVNVGSVIFSISFRYFSKNPLVSVVRTLVLSYEQTVDLTSAELKLE